MTRDAYHLLGAYVLGAVDDAERAEVEEFLAAHPEHLAEVESLREAGVHLAEVSAADPPADLRDRVLADAARSRPLPPLAGETPDDGPSEGPSRGTRRERRGASLATDELSARRRRRFGRWTAGLVAAAALAGAVTVWSPWSPDLEDDTGPPGQSQQQALAAQVLNAPDANAYRFEIGSTPATVTRSASMGKSVLTAEGLPPAPQGEAYQMWWQAADGSFVSAGMMPEVADREPVMLEGNGATALGAGVTLEPAGGSRQPTSPPLGVVSFA